MAEFYDTINDKLRSIIAEQKMFFVATAPPEGRVNLSPKGMDTLRVIDDRTVAYLDLTGSGNETAAHIQHDGRLTMMFCSFTAKPVIMRLFGHGRVVRPGDTDWDALLAHFTPTPGMRQIIVLDVDEGQTSCGYAVPRYEFVEERQTLRKWAEKKGDEILAEYQAANNTVSIDGLPIGPH